MKSKFTQTKTNLQGMAGKNRFSKFTFDRTIIFLITLIIANLFLVSSAFGQKTWDGGASTNNWGDANNWNPNGLPAITDAVTLINNTTVNVTANASCASITFPSTNSNNITLNINTGITLSVTGAVTINRGNNGLNTLATGSGILNAGSIVFGGAGGTARHFLTISTGTVTVAGNVTGTGGSGSPTITFTGSGLLKLGGSIFTEAEGTFTASTGSVEYYAAGAQTVGDLTYNNLTLSGSGAKTITGATVNGILSMEGAATATGTVTGYGAAATLQYKGNTTQTTGTEFPATFSGTGGVIIDNTNGVTLGASKTITRLSLTSGILATGANLISVTNTGTTGITGGSSTSFVNGPVRWTLPTLVSGSTYNFPVGKGTTYLPFSLVNPLTTGTTTAQVEAFTTSSGGTVDATLASISTSEYWSLSTAANFTNSSVSLTRQTLISPLDAIGGSATAAGQYVSLAGAAGTYGVTGSNSIGSTNRFFALAQKASVSNTYTSIAAGNWNDVATWDLNSVPGATSNVIIAAGPVTVNINSALLGNLTINTGSTLNMGSANSVSGTGTFTIAGTGTLLVGADNFPSGFSTNTLSLGSTVNYNGGAQTISVRTYGNLTLSGTLAKTFPAGTTTVNGVLSMEGTATATLTGTLEYGTLSTLQYNTSTARTAGAEWITPFTATGGVIIANTGAITMDGAKVFNASVPLTINSLASMVTNNFPLTLGGNLVTTGTLTAGSSPIEIANNMTTQSIGGFSTTGLISMTKPTGTATLQGNVNGAALTINGTAGILDLGSARTHTFSGLMTLTAGTLNGGSSALVLGGGFAGGGPGFTFTPATGTVEWNAIVPQTIPGGSFYNLILSGSGVKTLSDVTAVGGNFTMSGSATATPTALLTVTGITSLSGTSVLTLGAPELFSNSGAITLDGGTFSTGVTAGNSETVGTLAVTTNSTINLGTGDHSLSFAASNGVTWSGNLAITNWGGTAGATNITGAKIFFGSATGTLTGAQLARISFTGYPGAAILLSSGELVPDVSVTQSITTSAITGSPFCSGAAVSIPFTISGSFTAGNVFTAQLSDASGNFASPVTLGTLTQTGAGTISGTIPSGTPTGTGYLIRVVSSTPAVTGSNNGTNLTINSLPPVLAIGGGALSVCVDASTIAFTNGTPGGTWSIVPGTGTASIASDGIVTGGTSGIATIVYTVGTVGCTNTATKDITINGLPAFPIINGGEPNIVVGATTTFTSIASGGVWTSSDITIATVDPSTGLVTGVNAGIAIIKYTVTNVNGCSRFSTQAINVSLVSGIGDMQSYSGLELKNHPNPFISNSTISYSLPFDGNVTLTIRNLAGQVVKTLVSEMETKGNYVLNIDLGNLQSGVYLATLSLKNNGKELSKTIRVVKGR
jgi:hypothetical protein